GARQRVTVYDWASLMQSINRDVHASPELGAGSPPWLGYPGASADQLAAAETRLQTQLPPSYRQFLEYTNGWLTLNAAIDQLYRSEAIDWFRVANQDWIDQFLTGFNRGGGPATAPEHALSATLQVSEVGDAAVLLLNPEVKTTDGEW